MRENRTCGSEGGEAQSLPYPYPGDAAGGSLRSRCADYKSALPGTLLDARCARGVPTASRRSRGTMLDARCARGVPTTSRRSRGRCWMLAALAVCRLQVGAPGGRCWMLAALAVCRLQVGAPGPADCKSAIPAHP